MLQDVKGVGAKIEEKLNKLGIMTEEDIVQYLPRTYLDMGKFLTLSEVCEGDYALLKVEITEVSPYIRIRGGLGMVKATAACEGEIIYLTWFNMPYIVNKLSCATYYVYGKVGKFKKSFSMANPVINVASEVKKFTPVVAIYPLKETIPQATYRKIVESAIALSEPRSYVEGLDLKRAYLSAHFPPSIESMYAAHYELALNSLVNDLVEYRRYRSSLATTEKSPKVVDISELIAALDYELTPSQKVAWAEINAELIDTKPMNKLLLGDVGSGKTIVAILTLYANFKAGYQGVLLAPTEVLATQHYNTATAILAKLGVKVAKLCGGGISANERAAIKTGISSGNIDIVIGTHSCISEDVIYANLGLVVIDELQKFGVKQKADLVEKGQNVDCLVMSATPMPRTLAMIMYGDLTVSKLELRDTQAKIKTYIIRDDKLGDMYNYIKSHLDKGEQAFIICPRVEDGDGLELMSSKALYNSLASGEFKGYNIALIHGKMSSKDKESVMADFIANRTSVLVATSLLEVGIDAPNATIIAIMSADSFGLSSLHQLRGRVGRGDIHGECILHVRGAKVPERIKAMRDSNDGIYLAELDAEARGLGDIIGTRQSGRSGYDNYKVKITKQMVEKAKVYADKVNVDSGVAERAAITKLAILLN